MHPGEILRDEIEARGLSSAALAGMLKVPVRQITEILDGRCGIKTDTALRLSECFGTTQDMWLDLQKVWESRQADVNMG